MSGQGFAVVDLETTGLFPGGHDRIVELAVVHVDPRGSIVGTWETLINPERDLGPQHIHHIRAAEVLRAPRFAQIAAQLIESLRGRVLVAHNADFERRFLTAEFRRLGVEAPIVNEDTLCTMNLAGDFLPGSGRSLSDCCAAYGIEIGNAHAAAADAVATARLLQCYLRDHSGFPWQQYASNAQRLQWPSLPMLATNWVPRGYAVDVPEDFLQRIAVNLPRHGGPQQHVNYLALLDRCLLDRVLAAYEADSLVRLAEDLGLDRATCAELHVTYFNHLVRAAWADGVLTEEEIRDIQSVARLLRIDDGRVMQAMKLPTPEAASAAAMPTPPAIFTLTPGDLVVLTGEMSRSRGWWEKTLTARGLVPWGAVTKKVKLLAAADPDSLSGKAKKARDYGIPIVNESGLEALLK